MQAWSMQLTAISKLYLRLHTALATERCVAGQVVCCLMLLHYWLHPCRSFAAVVLWLRHMLWIIQHVAAELLTNWLSCL